MRTRWSSILVVALLVSGGVSLFASAFPDGLERVAADQGFLVHQKQIIAGLIPGYRVPGMASTWGATSLAGSMGALVVFGILLGIGQVLFSQEGRKGGKRR